MAGGREGAPKAGRLAGPQIRSVAPLETLFRSGDRGIVESWSICSEDVDWIPRDSTVTYEEYKQWYWGLENRFNPVEFDPDQWCDVMRGA